jgi:alpha-ketoglutarate-dependent taurine dioxygenase
MEGGLLVEWAGGEIVAAFPPDVVAALRAERSRARAPPRPLLGEGGRPAGRECVQSFSYDAVANMRATLLSALSTDGIALVTGCTTAGPEGVTSLANALANTADSCMHTIYGTTWVVEAQGAAATNIAYTTVGLELHQDLPYYESVPGLQLLLCASNPSTVKGGESTFMDAFAAAELLRWRDPGAFVALTRLPGTFQKIHYARARPVHLVYSRPHLSVAGKHSRAPTDAEVLHAPLTAVHWSPPFEGTPAIPDLAEEEVYWRARAAFAGVLESMQAGGITTAEARKLGQDSSSASFSGLVELRLGEGECVVFNNRRMLHGRRPYEQGEQGVRRLYGGYVSVEDWTSALTVARGVTPPVRVGDGNWL